MTRGKAPRTYSASEIARCPDKFEVWASHQACTLAALSDLPASMQANVQTVFNVSGRIPVSYVTEGHDWYKMLDVHFPSLHAFLILAHKEDATLFVAGAPENKVPLEDLCSVQSAWTTLNGMLNSSVKWSEADFAGKVYSLIRSPAVRQSRLRLQVPVSLPQPPQPPQPPHSGLEKRILAPQSVIPDASTFVANAYLSQLSRGKDSAFNTLKEKARPRGKFRHQATITAKLPDKEIFQFAGSMWEDKKPDQTHVDNAWRQNRMATAAAVRQCHAFRIETPVIGLVWGEGKVRAHIDWAGEQNGHVNVYSAPYDVPQHPGAGARRRTASHRESGASRGSGASAAPDFHEWDLSSPAAAIAVHIIVRNIDTWTKGSFRERIVDGVQKVAGDKRSELVAWKRAEVATKSPASENSQAPLVKKEPRAESEGARLDAPVPAAPATRRRRSGLRPRK